MITARIIDPGSKLATARGLSPETATSSLGTLLNLGLVDEDELYTAFDWLGERQSAIETTLARRHLRHGTLVLYHLSSSYMEGSCCPWPIAVTAGTAASVPCKLSMGCSARPTAAQSPAG
jgi:hypothetical protein